MIHLKATDSSWGARMINHGENTQDILRRHSTKPADPETLEARTRRFGRISVIVGLVLCIGTVVESLGMADAFDNGLFHSEPGRLFGLMAFVAQLMTGGFLVIAGVIEHVGRPTRERQRQTRLLIERLTIEHRERYDNLVGLTAVLPDRIQALERGMRQVEKALADVPTYGKGVIDGVQMRQDVLGGEPAEDGDRG